MKVDKFNILGITSFRVKNQIHAYSQLLEFLESEFNKQQKILSLDVLNKKFIKYCKKEGIYNYKDNDCINRLNMAIKLLKQIKVINVDKNNVSLDFESIKEFYDDKPEIFFFNKFFENFLFFKESINFLVNNYGKNINYKDFIISLLIFDKEETFEEVFNFVSQNSNNNYEKLFLNLSHKVFENKKLNLITPIDFYKYKKPLFGKKEFKDKLINLLNLKKNKKYISDEEYFVWKKWDFQTMHKFGFFGTYKQNKTKYYEQEYYEYISNVQYEKLILDLTRIRIEKLILKEYFDIDKRWLIGFDLIDKNGNIKIQNLNIKCSKDKNIYLKIDDISIEEYPFKMENIENYLTLINNFDFSFKKSIHYLSDVSNSTIAEYFVNLYYSMKCKIKPKDFQKNSRTILQTGTLYPQIHAPGRGPDYFHIIENKLRIIETTIHSTKKNVLNHEVFNVIDHVNLDNLNYLKFEERKKIISTEIILVSPLKKQNDLDEIKQSIIILSNNKKYDNSVNVTNFSEFIKKKW